MNNNIENKIQNPASIPAAIVTNDRSNLKSWGGFHVGGEYIKNETIDGTIMQGQMYVEVFEPILVKKPYPIVLIHGDGQNGLNWMGKAGGGAGWVDHLLDEGYIVYTVDAPTRGRASYFIENQTQVLYSAENTSQYFAGASNPNHTQFPGTAKIGDPPFDAFYAAQNTSLIDHPLMQKLMRDAGSKLLDIIGPAILTTHSQSGPFGWLLADVRPNLVKGIVALEPYGPAFTERAAAYGLTALPLTYDRPAAKPADIEKEETDPGDGKMKGYLQKEPARKLVNLIGIPILIITGSASYHVPYDYLIAAFLRQSGVENTHIYLGDEGILGNGHMMMLEKNNKVIVSLVDKWLDGHVF